jgi:uncharacterized protein (TIGR02145 family)
MLTVKIGSQEWASEDLKVTKFRNGEDIPLVTDNEEWAKLDTAAYCVTSRGNYLYNWYAVNDIRGLAPEGFYVPTDEEWTELIDFLGGEEVAGEKMKTEEWGGNNQSGFSALPGGYRLYYYGYFVNEGYNGYWWSSSANGTNSDGKRFLFSANDSVYRDNYYQRYGFSVRCLKNIQHQREMKKDKGWLILPMIALISHADGTKEVSFGWLNRTYWIKF